MKPVDGTRLVSPVATGLAVVSLAWASGPVLWRMLGLDPASTPAPAPMEAQSQASVAVDLEPIRALAPFGTSSRTKPLSAGTSTEGLVLRGVLASADPDRSLALVSAMGAPALSYRVGDVLPGGAVLRRVEPSSLLLDVAGGQATLSFPSPDRTAAILDAGSYAATATRFGVAAGPSALATSPAVSAAARTEETIEIYRRKVRDDPQALARELDVEALGAGYRVGSAPPDRLQRAGLRPGDVILRVNGVDVGDIEQDRQRFEDLAASDRLRVEVRRGDRLLVLSCPIR